MEDHLCWVRTNNSFNVLFRPAGLVVMTLCHDNRVKIESKAGLTLPCGLQNMALSSWFYNSKHSYKKQIGTVPAPPLFRSIQTIVSHPLPLASSAVHQLSNEPDTCLLDLCLKFARGIVIAPSSSLETLYQSELLSSVFLFSWTPRSSERIALSIRA